jgi:two-component system chemotaxis response regulator CheB
MIRRDIIAIGCSAGGVEALPRILQQLPADLPAAILIVQHLASNGPRYLADILNRQARVGVAWGEQGAKVTPGCVYVAPPDLHMLVTDGHLQLARTARENHSRPSIDKLFRSVAAEYTSRAIGVLLTGMLDDGVAGLRAIRDAGGTVIVQHPGEAAYPEMPTRAVETLHPERVLPLDDIGGELLSLIQEQVTPGQVPRDIALEASFDRDPFREPAAMDQLGIRTSLVCPECTGPMWQIGNEQPRRYRCYLGHVASARQMLDANDNEVESALWSAVRALHDRATTLETLSNDAKHIGNGYAAEDYQSRASEARAQANLARQFMLDLRGAR